jgi:hypothetical protein
VFPKSEKEFPSKASKTRVEDFKNFFQEVSLSIARDWEVKAFL